MVGPLTSTVFLPTSIFARIYHPNDFWNKIFKINIKLLIDSTHWERAGWPGEARPNLRVCIVHRHFNCQRAVRPKIFEGASRERVNESFQNGLVECWTAFWSSDFSLMKLTNSAYERATMTMIEKRSFSKNYWNTYKFYLYSYCIYRVRVFW